MYRCSFENAELVSTLYKRKTLEEVTHEMKSEFNYSKLNDYRMDTLKRVTYHSLE